MRSWVTRNRQSLSTSRRTRRTIPLQKRSADRGQAGDTARLRENPLLHRPAILRIRAVLLTSYRNKKIGKLTQLTQPLTSHHITSLFSCPQAPAFLPKTRLFPAHNAQALSIQPSILFSSVVKFPRGGRGTRLPNEQRTSPGHLAL